MWFECATAISKFGFCIKVSPKILVLYFIVNNNNFIQIYLRSFVNALSKTTYLCLWCGVSVWLNSHFWDSLRGSWNHWGLVGLRRVLSHCGRRTLNISSLCVLIAVPIVVIVIICKDEFQNKLVLSRLRPLVQCYDNKQRITYTPVSDQVYSSVWVSQSILSLTFFFLWWISALSWSTY